MSTNFYLEPGPDSPLLDVQPYLGSLHIGKRSGGLTFALSSDADLKLEDLEDWTKHLLWEGAVVLDEYGDSYTGQDMLNIIHNCASWRGQPSKRRYVDGSHCLAHDKYCDLLAPGFS